MNKKHLFLILSALLMIISENYAQNEGKTLYDQGNYLEAIKVFENQLQTSEGLTTGIQYYIGESYYQLGRLSENLYRTACHYGNLYYMDRIKTDPQNVLFNYFQGLCLSGLGKNRMANNSFQTCAKALNNPYSKYAKIWREIYSGSTKIPKSKIEKLEYIVALDQINKQTMVGGDIANIVPDNLDKNTHSLHRYIIASILNGMTEKTSNVLQKIDLSLLQYAYKAIEGKYQDPIRYYFYEPLLLKYLSTLYYEKALEFLSALEIKLENPDEIRVITRRISQIYGAMQHQDAQKYLESKNDLYIANILASVYWHKDERQRAEKIWRENIKSNRSDVLSLAGYYCAVYLEETALGLESVERAWSLDLSDQEVCQNLSEIYMMRGEKEKAMKVLDAGYNFNGANDPLYLLKYGCTSFENGSTRFNDALTALYKLQDTNKFARQVHYYIQGLIVNLTKRKIGDVK